MTLKTIFLALLLLPLNILQAQAPAWNWLTKAGGPGDDEALATATDKDGAIIVGGYFNGAITFGATTLSSFGSSDFFLVKYDSTGKVLWAKSGGGTLPEVISAIATDPWGNIIATGAFQSATMKFDNYTLTNTGSWDTFLAKLDPQGNVQWVNQLKCPDHDNANSVIVDSTSIVLGGTFKRNLIVGNDTLINVNTGTYAFDVFLVKYDLQGNVIWAKSMGGTNQDVINALSFDLHGNILATGYYFSSTITFGATTLTNTGSDDIFLTKFNRQGDVLWAKKAGGTYNDYAYALAVDHNNNPVISGYYGSAKLYFEGDSLVKLGGATFDTFLSKYDSNGNVLWLRRTGNASMTVAYAVCTDQNNNILVGGNYSSYPLLFGGDTLANTGAFDIFLLKYDALGNELWAKKAGGQGYDEISSNCLAISPNGAIILAGGFYSDSIFFDATALVNTVVGDPISNKKDMFLAVLSPNTLSTGTSIPETPLDMVLLYPNPTNGIVNIESANPIQQVKIFNSTGQQVALENVHGLLFLTVTLESDGVFFVQIVTDKQITTKKILVKK